MFHLAHSSEELGMYTAEKRWLGPSLYWRHSHLKFKCMDIRITIAGTCCNPYLQFPSYSFELDSSLIMFDFFSVSLTPSNRLHYCAAKHRLTMDHELHLMPAARSPPAAIFITAQRHRMNPNGLKISLAIGPVVGIKPMLQGDWNQTHAATTT